MNQHSQAKDDDTGRTTRKYEKPSFQHEVVFETMALACGKINATQGQCHLNRKFS